MLLWGSFSDAPLGLPGKLTLDHYRTAYSDPETLEMILNSFVFAAGSAFLSIVFAAVIAWVVIRTTAPCRRLLELITVVPNIMPPLLIAVAWTLLLNPSTGVINILVMKVFGLSSAPFNVYSMGGMIFVEGLILTPLAFLIIAAALSSMDPSLEESARMSGSTHLRVVGRVTLPLVRPAILAAATLNFVRAIESFDTPAILALPARLDVFTSKIYKEALDAFPPNHNLAASYAMSLLVITLGLVYVYRLMIRRAERFATVTGKGFRPALIDLGRSRYLAAAIAAGILVLLVVFPFFFPGTALGIGLLWAYVRFPIPVIATIWILLIGYVTRFLPYGLRSMTATIVQIHRELEEASQISGGGFAVTFRKILLPLMKPGFLGGWILLATIFIREFSLSVFLYTPASEPIGPLLYHLWLDGLHGRMAALGVVVTLLSTGLVMVAMRLARPRE